MTKHFTRIEPTDVYESGGRFKTINVVKHYQTDDGMKHEFTTRGKEGSRSGAVIALTPEGSVIVSYQFRAGPEKWMYELPGGGFKDGESNEDAAKRELLEESGYIPGKVEYLGESCRGGYFNTAWHYFIATDCVLADSGSLRDDTETDQGMETRLISITNLLRYAKTNQMSDPHAVLMAYDQLKELEKKYETTN